MDWPALCFSCGLASPPELLERAKAQAKGVGRDAPAGSPERPPKAR
jgi:hypothetical protein